MTRNTLLPLFALLSLTACRGKSSTEPPIVVIRNMYTQTKYVHQGESEFFADGRQMRLPPQGTVAREMEVDPEVATGRLEDDSDWVVSVPQPVVDRFGGMDGLVHRGQQRFDIYCVPCHGRLGDGDGMVVARGLNRPPSYHDDRVRHMPDGQMFETITNGVRNMPGYYAQIPVDDRWAIVSYVRALQISQQSTRPAPAPAPAPTPAPAHGGGQ